MRKNSILALVLILVLCLATTMVFVGCNLVTHDDPHSDNVNPDDGGGTNPPVNPDEGGNKPPVNPDEGGGNKPSNPDGGGDVVTHPHIIFMVDGVEYTRVECVGFNAINVENPTKKNYNFDGWYSDEELTKWFNLDNVILCEVEEDITLYAKFVKIEVFEYRLLSNDTYEVTGIKADIDATSIEIPAQYNGKDVTSIASQAFLNKGNITNVTIPNSVVNIGEFAFSGCLALTGVAAPSVTSLGKYAFNDCPNITEVSFSKDVEVVGEGVLNNSTAITKATLPTNMIASLPNDNLKEITINGGDKIADSAFENCATLETVTIVPQIKMTTIGAAAFKGCTGIKKIVIPSTVTSVGNDAFADFGRLTIYAEAGNKPQGWSNTWTPANCPVVWGNDNTTTNDEFDYVVHDGEVYLTKYKKNNRDVIIPDSIDSHNVVSMGAIFAGNNDIAKVKIPNTIRNIGPYAFKDCSVLQDIVFAWESKLENISKEAFSGCANITLAVMPALAIDAIPKNNLITIQIAEGSSINAAAFENCTTLENIYIGKDVEKIDATAFAGCVNVTNAYIPTQAIASIPKDKLINVVINGGDVISSNAFANCATLESVKIAKDSTISKIESSAFSGCTAITDIVIPDSVKSISDSVFCGCTALQSVQLPAGLTSVGSSAFSGCTALTSIAIPSSVTSIGSDAFNGCSGLNRVDTTDIAAWYNINFRGWHANPLEYAHNLYLNGELVTNLEIPEGVTSIGNYAFKGCSALTSITIPSSVTSIGYHAFDGCSALTSVTLGENSTLTSIGSSAFSGCTALTSITIPSGVTSIGYDAFANCKALTSINLPNGLTRIEDSTFAGCAALTSITIPDSVETICEKAFFGCGQIKDVIFGENSKLTNIQKEAFSRCYSIVSMTFPSSLTEIGWSAFQYCDSLISVSVAANSNLKGIYSAAFMNCTRLETVKFPDSVTFLGADVFNNCTSLKSFIVPRGVTSIGGDTFYNCTSLTSIMIPDSVATISEDAFIQCTALTIYVGAKYKPNGWVDGWNKYKNSYSDSKYCPVVWGVKSIDKNTDFEYAIKDDDTIGIGRYMGNGTEVVVPSQIEGKVVKTIENHAFYNCSSVTNIIVPDSVTTIKEQAFENCSSIASITLPYCPSHIGDIFDGYVVESNGSKNNIPETLKEIILTGGTSIGDSAFYNCSSLTSITIPSSVISIGWNAFNGCNELNRVDINDLAAWCNILFNGGVANPLNYANILYLNGELVTDLVIPSSVTSIGDDAFRACTSIKSLTIPSSVTSIGAGTFSVCTGLASVTIPSSVKSIDSSAFSDCSSLASVTFGENSELTSIGNWTFKYCTSLTSITIPDSVTSIGEGAFRNCTSLASVTIPSSVTSISDSTFYGCSSLTSITIPNSCTTIRGYAFSGCNSLASIIIPNSVTRILQNAFLDCSLLKIHAEAASEPSDWIGWNPNNRPVVWGYNNITTDANYDYVVHDNKAYLTNYKGTDKNVVVPNQIDGIDVVSIGEIFRNNGNILSVTLPNTITNIPSQSFYKCGYLTSITMSEGVTSIGYAAFSGCSSLTNITIPNSVTSIGNNAFYNCIKLTSIIIPSSVTSIGYYAFYGCSSLTIYAGAESKPSGWNNDWKPADNKVVWNVKSIGKTTDYEYIIYNGDKAAITKYLQGYSQFTKTIEIPSQIENANVTMIGDYAFIDCPYLRSVTIPSSVTSIGEGAFDGCESLISIIIPESVTSIGGYTFSGCTRLTIYAEAASKPVGWNSEWNSSYRPVYWYSETEPTGTPATGNGYWHYDADGVTPVIWEKKTI